MLRDTLILIPAYNEEKSIEALLRCLQESGVKDYADVLVVDDCSSDSTGIIARSCGELTIRNVFNLGYGSAVQLGYKYAVRRKYKYVIQLDADGQHDICNIRRLFDALHQPQEACGGELPDIVIGSRFLPGSQSFPISGIKRLAIRLFSAILYRVTGCRISDPTSGLQGLSRSAFLYYSQYNHFNARYPDANMILQMLLLGYNVMEVPSVMHARETGTSMHAGVSRPLFYMMVMTVSIFAVAWRERDHRKDCLQKHRAIAAKRQKRCSAAG